jgi:putative membrane protein
MIRNFSDHSANERTFLAWVRTAIAVMAFGFLVEKFDLFLEVAAPSLAGRTLSLPGQKFGNRDWRLSFSAPRWSALQLFAL